MNFRFLLLCTAICAVLPLSAQAGFAIVNSPPAAGASDAASVLPPGANQVVATAIPNGAFGSSTYDFQGNAPAMTPGPASLQTNPRYLPSVLNGFGRDIPLSIAVKQMVPAGTHVNFDSSVDTSIPVTWHGGKPWQEALADALRPNSLFISTSGNNVTISTARPQMMQPAQAMVGPPQVSIVTPMALAPIEVPTWTAKSSDTLHQTLETWCRKAGVALRWDSEFDYPIETNVSLTGDFETSVRTLLRGLKNASPSPVARYYRGKDGMPGVLLVPSPGGEARAAHSDSAPLPSLPPAVMPAISNTPQNQF